MTNKNWRDMSDSELRSEARAIVRQEAIKNMPTAEAVTAELKSKFDYPYHVAVTFSQPNGAGQRMVAGTMHGKNRNTIHF